MVTSLVSCLLTQTGWLWEICFSQTHSAEREEMVMAYEVQEVRPDLQRLTAPAHSATQATLATVALHWGELSPRELLIKAVRHKVVLLCRNWRWSQR